jgi:hypothetical protein
MADPNELFAIVPLEGKAPPEAICIGPISEVFEYIGGSVARSEKEAQLAKAQRNVAETERAQDKNLGHMAQLLVDRVEHLTTRMDQFQARRTQRAERLQRAEEAAEAARIEAMLDALPDPDSPHALGDDGELTAVIPPTDPEKHDPEHRNEAATGILPKELDRAAPPEPGDYSLTGSPPSPFRNPVGIGGN